MEIITQKEAKSKGLRHYFTGNMCKNGHIERRFVSGWKCCKCSSDSASKSYQKNRIVINSKAYAKKFGYDYSKRTEITEARRAIEERLEMKKLDQSINLT